MNLPFATTTIPANETQRLAALKRYQILNTPAEQAFDNISILAKTIFNVSAAHISFMDANHEFIKSDIGLSSKLLVNRDETLCQFAILSPDVTVFNDTLYEPQLAGVHFVKTSFDIRFYAGAPLITPDGFNIGMICIVDTQPRSFSEHEKEILQGLAKVAMEQTELRFKTIKNTEKQDFLYKELSINERRLQSIIDTMAEGVGIVDENGLLTYTNSMAQQIFGKSAAEMMSRTFYDSLWQNLHLDGSPLAEAEHPMSIMMATGKPVYDQEIAIQPVNGERFFISINAAPIFDLDGNLTGGIGTFMDVTNRRKATQQKEEFISIASHELKTPVTSLKASMQIMNRMKNNPQPVILSKLIEQSNRSLNKLINLINDLLNTNRITEGQLFLQKTTFNLTAMLNDCCHHIKSAGTHQIIVEGDPEIIVHADEQQIEQVVVNIVNNAAKYAANSKDILITVSQVNNMIKVAIKDNGSGVPSAKIPHLFDRYFRSDYSGVQFSGLGLGLYICAEIVKKHGGEIGVDSEVGLGSTFWFTLPID